MVSGEAKVERFDALRLLRGLEAATLCLERYRDHINALNIFPVPDGDTGTNMLLTMRAVVETPAGAPTDSLSALAALAARQAVLGSRGNSGVILSQFLTGFARGLDGCEDCDSTVLAAALSQGATAAYAGVSQPLEGTMLTVMRDLSGAAAARASNPDADVIAVLRSAVQAAHESLRKTPSLLPVLRDAGVVDSGGQGVVVFMEGLLCALLVQDPHALEVELCLPNDGLAMSAATVSQRFLDSTAQEEYGFCTQFLVEADGLDLSALRTQVSQMGSSAVVVGDASLAKVHLHTFEPQTVLQFAATLGVTSQVRIDDIDQQHQDFRALHQQRQDIPALGVVAVTWGEGFAALFQGLGCHSVVPCGRTMNPSTQQLLDAVRGTGAPRSVILPNNPNVVLTARQAVSLSGQGVHFIPTTTIPQGVAALLAYSPDAAPEEALRAMERAIQDVTTVEVTTAVRDTRLSGVDLSRGQVIGLVDGKLAGANGGPFDVLMDTIRKAPLEPGGVITIYWGGDTQEAEAQDAGEQLRAAFSEQQVDVVYGGQPFYHYLASIE